MPAQAPSPLLIPSKSSSPTPNQPLPIPELRSVMYPAPAPAISSSNSNGFHPNPTWSWNPYPTIAWLPINPINIPDNSTPCKRFCRHPCGWGWSMGESVCCEASANGGCDMVQINGYCYCN